MKKVVTMAVVKNSVKVGNVDVLDTTVIYSRVMALKMYNTIIEVKVLFSYELEPLPTSMFDEFGEIRVDKSKAKLRKLLVKEVSCSKYLQASPRSTGWLYYTMVSQLTVKRKGVGQIPELCIYIIA